MRHWPRARLSGMHTWLIALQYLAAAVEQPSPPTPACQNASGVDVGDVASLASAVIALGALAMAWWAARGSSRAARSSETSARAAEQTVELTRQAQHQAERPEFMIGLAGPERAGRARTCGYAWWADRHRSRSSFPTSASLSGLSRTLPT